MGTPASEIHAGPAVSISPAAADLLCLLPVGVVASDVLGTPLWWNPAAEVLLGPDLRLSTMETLKARAIDESGVLRFHSTRIETEDAGVLVWTVVTEAHADNDLLNAFAHQALHDPLTGLPNRSLLDDRVRQAVNRSERSEGYIAVAFLDIDHFKLINDTQGHAEGDALLRAVADRILGAVRPGDTVARFGGDEFVVVCEGVADAAEATQVGDRLREVLEPPFVLRGEEFYVSASIGVALGSSGDTAEGLLRDADAAMYHAKMEGRARTELFDEEIRVRAERRRSTEKALRHALEESQFELLYQPIVSLEAGWVVGAEALVRWHHPAKGVIMPNDFISVAEETGLILPLGEWVIDEACRQLREWRSQVPHVPLFMSINVSARQLRNRITDVVSEAARRHDVEMSELVLEITEGTLVDDTLRSVEVLEELKSAGLKIAIDDFGTGYSTFGYLKRVPIDVIKIDQTFICGLGSNAKDSAIVSAIAAIARALKVSVVAEGVETADQLCALRRLTCQQAQGYHFARPISPDDFAELIGSGQRW
jgi:diguanylate cyclase (GGDEF)-like protein